MRQLAAIFLALGLTAPALAADEPPAEQSSSVPWYRWLFLGEREKPAAVAPATASPSTRTPAAGSPAAAVPSREAIAKRLADEQRVYLERLNAISKIRLLASEQGDDAMLKKADDLEAQAEELFKLRTALLPSPEAARDDRALLERGRDTRPAAAQRPATRQRDTRRN